MLRYILKRHKSVTFSHNAFKYYQKCDIMSRFVTLCAFCVERGMMMKYKKALGEDKAFAFSVSAESFMSAYREMTRDFDDRIRTKQHRKNQTVKVKGIFKNAFICHDAC